MTEEELKSEFKIDNVKIAKIAREFQQEEDLVKLLNKAYGTFSPYLQEKYLAHVMRGMESYIRIMMKNNRFIIICEPYREDEFSEGQSQANTTYYPPRVTIRSTDKQNSSFIINYNGKLPEKEKRDYIAHEIGHIFLVALRKNKDVSWGSKSIPNTEPLSSIFGIFTMSEKNDFYANYDFKLRNHDNWQELFDYFIKIHKN